MERIAELHAIVAHEVADYTRGDPWQSRLIYIEDSQRQIYTVVVIPDLPRPFKARVVVMARVVGDKVIIEEDTTNKPLCDELLRVGIPREQIVLVYEGEALPEDR